MAQEHNEHAIPIGESEHPPKHGGQQIAGVAPVSTAQAPRPTKHVPATTQEEHNRLPIFPTAAGGIALVCTIIYFARKYGVFTPEWIQTTLTLILAGWAGMQWLTYHRQWKVMQAQHKVMRQQIKMARLQLQQAAKASEQTDEIIAQMRLEQRAWVCIGKTRIHNRTLGSPLSASVQIINRGRLPARLIDVKSYVEYTNGEPPEPLPIIVNERLRAMSVRYGVIPHLGKQYLSPNAGKEHTRELEEQILHGSLTVWLYGRIYYRDGITDEPRKTTFCLWLQHGGVLRYEDRYNEMT